MPQQLVAPLARAQNFANTLKGFKRITDRFASRAFPNRPNPAGHLFLSANLHLRYDATLADSILYANELWDNSGDNPSGVWFLNMGRRRDSRQDLINNGIGKFIAEIFGGLNLDPRTIDRAVKYAVDQGYYADVRIHPTTGEEYVSYPSIYDSNPAQLKQLLRDGILSNYSVWLDLIVGGEVTYSQYMQDFGIAFEINGEGDATFVGDPDEVAATFHEINRHVPGLLDSFGSSLGNALASNQLEGIIYSSFLGEVGERLGVYLQTGQFADLAVYDASLGAAHSFGYNVGVRVGAAAIGTVSSWLTMELGEALGLEGFGAELFTTVGATVTNHIIGNLLAQGSNFAFAGISTQSIGEALGGVTKEALANGANAANLASALASAVGAFIGARLGAMVVAPETQAAVVLSSVGSAVGAYIGTAFFASKFAAFGNIIAPGIGAFVGFVLGALIGNLFGRKQKPKVPTASASTFLNFTTEQFDLGYSTSANGGSLDLMTSMATSARDTLNGFLSVMRGEFNSGLQQGYSRVYSNFQFYTVASNALTIFGHTGNQIWYKIGSQYSYQNNVTSADEAVEKGILAALGSTLMVGGDILAKRVISAGLGSNDLTSLMGNLQIASDYRFYGNNRELINGFIKDAYASLTETEQSYYTSNKVLIDKVQAVGAAGLTSGELSAYNGNKVLIDKIVSAIEAQGVANPWIITLQRVSELGLGAFATSDFYGGLQGFMMSFDLAGHDAWLEDVTLSQVGADLRIALPGTIADGLFTLLPQATADGRAVDVTDFFAGSYYSGNTVGYTVSMDGQISANSFVGGAQINDFVDQSASSYGVTIADYTTWEEAQYWWVNPNTGVLEALEEPIYVTHTVTGGDDIFLGGYGNDTLQGYAGWDWLAGGAGDDIIDGGYDNDVLIGGDGADTLYGGHGADYLAGGTGNDTLSGESGDDVLIGGAGSDSLNGGDGNDMLLVDQNDGVYDYMDGSYGLDALSFERWSQGVTFALGSGVVSGDGYANIEDVIGSRFVDTIAGDGQANRLYGAAGNDTLSGGDGNDTLEGGAGQDVLTGGNGVDTASYESSAAGVFADLTANEGFGGDARADTFSGIENLRGSRHADVLKGDAGANRLEGGEDDDWLVATAGADVFDGGKGSDTVDYSEATAGVSIYLGGLSGTTPVNGYGYAGLASGHTYIGVEAAIGSDYADYLSAAGDAQAFVGGKGNDTLAGGAGADVYYFEAGAGQDVISDTNTDENSISFGREIGFNTLSFSYAGGSGGFLDIYYSGSDYVRISGNFATSANNVLKLIDMNGAGQLDVSQIHHFTGGGTTGGDTIYGYAGYHDLIAGYGGNDVIYGSGGSWEDKGNVIIGGAGDDYIVTSAGDDQFAFERGSGRDTVTDAGGEDTLVFGPNVAADDVIYKVVGNDLYVGIAEEANPTYEAHQVTDYVRVVNGAIRYENSSTGAQSYAGVEFINAGGSWIDLRKLSIDWVTSYTSGWPPIVLDLDADGLDLIGVDDSLIVSKLASGRLTRTSWVGPTDGILAVDRDGDGQINRTSEISFLGDKAGAKTDLEGLQAWDTNGDGKITGLDEGWSRLKLWVDANQNGRSTTGELKTLDEIGIVAINLTGTPTGMNFANAGGDSFVHNTLSFTWASGAEGRGYDVELARKLVGGEALSLEQLRAAWGDGTEDSELGRLITEYRLVDNGQRSNRRWHGRTGDTPLTLSSDPDAAFDDIDLGFGLETVAEQRADFSDHDNVFAEELARQAQRRRQTPQGLVETDAAVRASLDRLVDGIDRPGRFDRPFRLEEGPDALTLAQTPDGVETSDQPRDAARARALDPASGSPDRRRPQASSIDLDSAVERLTFGQDPEADPWAAAPVTLAGGPARMRWWGEAVPEKGVGPSSSSNPGSMGTGLFSMERIDGADAGAANLSAHQKLTQAMAAFGARTTGGAAVWKRSGEMDTAENLGADTGSSRWRFGAPARISA